MKSNRSYECPSCYQVFSTVVGYIHHSCPPQSDLAGLAMNVSFGIGDVPEYDSVEKPEGYTQGKIECIDYIADKKLDLFEGNVVKYITRHKFKDGKRDIEKAGKYIRMMLERYEELYGK